MIKNMRGCLVVCILKYSVSQITYRVGFKECRRGGFTLGSLEFLGNDPHGGSQNSNIWTSVKKHVGVNVSLISS